jgi:thymidylate kinase
MEKTSTPTDRAEEQLVLAVQRAWREAGIRFVILRNYERLPASIGNDMDVLVARDDLPSAEKLLISCAVMTGFVLHNRAEFSPVSLFFYHKDSHQQLHFDLFHSLAWRGFEVLAAPHVLAQRIDKGLFAVPHPTHEAVLNLLTRLLYGGYVKDVYKDFIHQAFSVDPGLARETLTRPFGRQLAAQLVDQVLAHSWSSIEAQTRTLRTKLAQRQLVKAPLTTIRAFGHEIARLTRRLRHPPGLLIVFAGPDGCGKSSVSQGILARLGGTFDLAKSTYFHWKPSVLWPERPRNGSAALDPHSKPVRPLGLSIIFFLRHLADFYLGAILRILPVTFKNALVAVDRYYYDFFIDQRRFRLSIPQAVALLGYRFLLKPDIVFCLDAPPAVIQARKQEVPFEETARQQAAYLALVETLPNGRIVDASRPLEQVISDVESIILEHMSARTLRRLKLES